MSEVCSSVVCFFYSSVDYQARFFGDGYFPLDDSNGINKQMQAAPIVSHPLQIK
jgi:hypothetical protein